MSNLNYSNYKKLDTKEKLDYFISTLAITNKTVDFFVNWDKVTTNTKEYELELNTLNYLIGKENIYEEALKLFEQQPNLLKAIPSLIAIRDESIDYLVIDDEDKLEIFNLDFKQIDKDNIEGYVLFLEQCGLLRFLQSDAKKSLVDYVYGVETGLDSNARKNRSGKSMETIVNSYVTKVCDELDLKHCEQATPSFIKSNYGIEVKSDKSQRRFDEAIYDPKNNHIYLIECNFYNDGGSKLKSVAGEFKDLNHFVTDNNVTFIWVTDGQGWKKTSVPLSDAMAQIDNVFNIQMLEDGYLDELIKSK